MAINKHAVADVAEIIHFEHWIRFYFIREEGETLKVEIPSDVMDEIEKNHPALLDLAKLMDGNSIDFQSSMETVMAFVSSRLDGAKYTTNTITNMLDSKDFQVEMQLFNLWLQGHEGYLDEKARSFGEWQELYEGWLNLDKVQEFKAKMLSAPEKQDESDTIH